MKHNQKGNGAIFLFVLMLMICIIFPLVAGYEHMQASMGGESFDVANFTVRAIIIIFIYTTCFSLAMTFILPCIAAISFTWPVWMIGGFMFYSGELIFATKYLTTIWGR